MSGNVVVESVTYRWTVEEDWRNYSLDFPHRGVSYPDTVKIVADTGAAIEFHPLVGMKRYGWWRNIPSLDNSVIARAIEIAQRTGANRLGAAEVHEAYYGAPIRTLQEELDAATVALRAIGGPNDEDACSDFADCWLAIGGGAFYTSEARPATDMRYVEAPVGGHFVRAGYDAKAQLAIDDWIASHADELVALRPRLQRLLELEASDFIAYAYRSALQFLLDACERMGVGLGLETAAVDAALQQRAAYSVYPWGIPVSHVWWRKGDWRDHYRDPYDD